MLFNDRVSNTQFDASKMFVHADRILSWLTGAVPVPVTLELDLTLECNDKCPRCVSGHARDDRHLPLSRIERLLVEASELGIQGLTLTGGGEPLMHPEIRGVLGLVRRSGLSAGLFTNGGLLSELGIARELVRTFRWVRVSLDSGSEEQFRRVRGRRDFARRLKGLQALVEARCDDPRDCDLGVSFLTSSEVACDVVAAAREVRDLGFDYIQFKPMISWREESHHGSPMLSQDGVFEAIERAFDLETDRFRVLVSWDRYRPELEGEERRYSGFHSAWFVATVGPSLSGKVIRPTLYLDCSAKYLPCWTICEFDSLADALRSEERRAMIGSVSSDVFCVPSEKHSAYNYRLDQVLGLHKQRPLTYREVRTLAPDVAKHPMFL